MKRKRSGNVTLVLAIVLLSFNVLLILSPPIHMRVGYEMPVFLLLGSPLILSISCCIPVFFIYKKEYSKKRMVTAIVLVALAFALFLLPFLLYRFAFQYVVPPWLQYEL